ncbi:MAG TPA: hypothetical protein VM489_00705 [Burkholderiales bacterium]|nr:hypothetical protein [Burkholderiales bacterium]
MSLSNTVAFTALLIIVLLTAGHALAKGAGRAPAPAGPCIIKPVMTDAEIDACRVAPRGR